MAWITPREWRKHVSSQYVELSDGDLLLEVEKWDTHSILRRKITVELHLKMQLSKFHNF